MRFADLDGSMIDVYQATTQMTDESGQTYPYTIDTLLDNALGPIGYYGVFTANMHTDNAISDRRDAIVASAPRATFPSSRPPDARLARRPQRVVVRVDFGNSHVLTFTSWRRDRERAQRILPMRSGDGAVLTSIALR